MSAPWRIKEDGREEDRALLRAQPPVPAGLQERLRLAIERRVTEAPARRRRWGAGLLVLLAGGTAFAYTQPSVRQAVQTWLSGPVEPAAGPARSARQPGGPDWEPLTTATPPLPEQASSPRPAAPPPAAPSPASRPVAVRSATSPAPPAVLHPELRDPPGAWGPASGADGEAVSPRPPALPPLRIVRQGRVTELRATQHSVEGILRGVGVSVRLDGAHLTGKVNDQPIDLFIRNHRGSGTIAGEATGFALAENDEGGGIVRGWIPRHSVRAELGRTGLRVFPGCDSLLRREAPGVYRGRCANGETMEVVLPPAFEAMPLMPRLLLLGMLLTDRDPVFRYEREGLFPKPL